MTAAQHLHQLPRRLLSTSNTSQAPMSSTRTDNGLLTDFLVALRALNVPAAIEIEVMQLVMTSRAASSTRQGETAGITPFETAGRMRAVLASLWPRDAGPQAAAPRPRADLAGAEHVSALPVSAATTTQNAGAATSVSTRLNNASPFPSLANLPKQTQRATPSAAMPGLSAVSSSTDAQIKYMKLPIYYLPERLLDQPLDMTDPDLLSLFKKRFLKVKLRLPQKPGTYDAIMRVVKAAFLEQKVSVHIDQDKVEFAHFDDDNLTDLPFNSDQMNTERFETHYAKSACVLVPVDPTIVDPDFHAFKRDVKGKSSVRAAEQLLDEDEFADSLSDLPDFSTGRNENRITSWNGKSPSPFNFDDKEVSSGPNDARCFKCCAVLLPNDADASNYGNGRVGQAETEHMLTCPRKDCPSFTFMTDFEDAGGCAMSVMSNYMPADMTGIDGDMIKYLKMKTKKMNARLEGRPTPTGSSSSDDEADHKPAPIFDSASSCAPIVVGSCASCDRPDEVDHLIQCEACTTERWFYYSCAKIASAPRAR
ncbi:hypothetical protein V8E36_009567 [Tilletia maclaganii]